MQSIKDGAYRLTSRSPNYVKAFGPLNGLRLLFQSERPRREDRSKIKSYRVPGYPAPFFLRDTVSDHAIFWQCIVRDQYAVPSEVHARWIDDEYARAVASGARPLIIDCGGNIGLSAAWFARRYPAADVHVIEPDANNLAMLRRNVAGFGGRVTAHHGGVWNHSGHLRIVNPEAGSSAFRVDLVSEASEGTVPVFTIDDICASASGRVPFIVKVDIEGAQKQLFDANPAWVGRATMIMLELDDWCMPWQGTSSSFFATASQHPFDYLLSGETICCIRAPAPLAVPRSHSA